MSTYVVPASATERATCTQNKTSDGLPFILLFIMGAYAVRRRLTVWADPDGLARARFMSFVAALLSVVCKLCDP